MSTNQYFFVTYRVASCLNGGVLYRSVSSAEEFEQSLLEERGDAVHQQPGRSYMRMRSCATGEELWMVPFVGNGDMLDRLLDAMEIALPVGACAPMLHLPVDVAASRACCGYLHKPMERSATVPFRSMVPNTETPRWEMAISLFQRVGELHGMGLTSNGLSREQMRCDKASGEVHLWLTERLTPADGRPTGQDMSHGGFLALPARTERRCRDLGIPIDGRKRDLFSAAAAAFYLLICEHPFVGAEYAPLLREMYLEQYHSRPDYVLRPGTENHFGGLSSGILKRKQWEQTVPELRMLFDQIFLAVTDPAEYWKPELECWKLEHWTRALAMDKRCNDKESLRMHFDFSNSVYHIV